MPRGSARAVRLTSAEGVIGIGHAFRHMFRLDADLSEFYALVRDDPEVD